MEEILERSVNVKQELAKNSGPAVERYDLLQPGFQDLYPGGDALIGEFRLGVVVEGDRKSVV